MLSLLAVGCVTASSMVRVDDDRTIFRTAIGIRGKHISDNSIALIPVARDFNQRSCGNFVAVESSMLCTQVSRSRKSMVATWHGARA